MNNTRKNQLHAYLQLTKVSILTTLRNKTSLFFNFFFPFIFISIFGLVNYEDATFSVAVREDSQKSGIVYEALGKVKALKLISDKTDEQITEDLKKGRLGVALTIKEVTAIDSLPSTYTVITERSSASPQSAASVVSILDTVISSINASATPNAFTLVTQTTHVVEGRKYNQIDFILPGQLSFALMMNALFGIAFTIVTYRKKLILKRYAATPVKKSTILLGEMTGKTFIAVLQAVLIVGAGHLLYGFTLAHGFSTFLSMIFLSVVGIVTFLSFGLLVPTIGKTEDSVSPISQVIMMPQLFLSGAFFPVETLPAFLQPITKILPMTLLNEAFRKVAFEGTALIDTLPQILGTLAWGVGLFTVVLLFFRWDE